MLKEFTFDLEILYDKADVNNVNQENLFMFEFGPFFN